MSFFCVEIDRLSLVRKKRCSVVRAKWLGVKIVYLIYLNFVSHETLAEGLQVG